jgi:hypothetical protein
MPREYKRALAEQAKKAAAEAARVSDPVAAGGALDPQDRQVAAGATSVSPAHG